MYDTFFCPLTKQIMDDAVTIESGVTYERNAISEWFETFSHLEDITCPTTGMKLTSRVLSTNVALKTTIEQWKDRNDVARIKVARAALSLASSDSMILEAIRDLQHICKRKQYSKVQVLSAGILPLLNKLLGYKDRDVRCEALDLLRQLAEDDDKGKEMIADTMDMSTLVELLSSSHQPVLYALLLFLLELSRSDEILKNLERVRDNIKPFQGGEDGNGKLLSGSHSCIQVNPQGHKISSDYVIYSIISMLKNSKAHELNIKLIRILLSLTKSSKSMATAFSALNEPEASYTLIEFINYPHEQLGGLPESLIYSPAESNHITEKKAVSAKFVAKLPQQNLTLNLALLHKNVVPIILQKIDLTQRSGIRTSRHATVYTHIGFTELLTRTSSDEVQRLSAIGLENLSLESINLSKLPTMKKTKSTRLFHLPKLRSSSSTKRIGIPLICPVHRGVCSSETTFCLIDAKAVERLLACLDHENGEVVEASMGAISTLLDVNVEVDKSVSLLNELNTIQHILNAVTEHKEDGLSLPASLDSAFHHGNGSMRQIAESILRRLNRMPSSSTSYHSM
ncbi:DNA-directed RNA polymerase isoform 1 [Hibiscus syriacus]|uniref:RING-type E3 ubiquitin transferase n=1 Tax=Hibiscus syriacus TaxID=106335 RepID=A0A6A2XDF4_HIBSY|nr:DNA-directed RNA polymerase isoform 1 [Hibiscus syriacus]